MSNFSKIVGFIPKGDEIHLKDLEKKILVRPTKQEDSFRSIENTDSVLFQFCKLAGEDPIIRSLTFGDNNLVMSPNRRYPLILQFPLFADFDSGFYDSIEEDAIKAQVEDMTQKSEKIEYEMRDTSLTVTMELFKIFNKDSEFQDRFRKRRIPRGKDADELFARILERNKVSASSIIQQFLSWIEEGTLYAEYYQPLILAVNNSSKAKNNHELLNHSINLPTETNMLQNAIGKISANRLFRLRVDSFCLECRLRNSLEPWQQKQIHTGRPAIIQTCSKCGGITVFHLIMLEIPPSLVPIFYERHLQEFVTAFTLSKLDVVDRIFVHKKIHPIKKNQFQKGHEIDIFLITKDERRLITEVTTSTDLNYIMKNIKKKEKNFNTIEYDKLIYVTPTLSLDKYLEIGDTIIMGGMHLNDLSGHFKYIIENKI